jgi:hypothetical protein
VIIDAKRMLVECLVTRQKTIEETLEYLRSDLINAMKNGHNLVIAISDCAPDFLTRFTSPRM